MFHVEHQIRSLIFELAVSNEIAATYFTFSHFFSCSLLSIARSSSGRFQTLSASHDSLFHVKHCSPVCSLSERIVKTYVNMHAMTNNNLETDQETPHSKELRCRDALTVDLRKQVGWISSPCFTWNNEVIKCSCRDTSPGQTATASCRPAPHQLSGDSNSSRLVSPSACFPRLL